MWIYEGEVVPNLCHTNVIVKTQLGTETELATKAVGEAAEKVSLAVGEASAVVSGTVSQVQAAVSGTISEVQAAADATLAVSLDEGDKLKRKGEWLLLSHGQQA